MAEARPQWWLWYAIAAALGVYTHLNMVFVTAGQLVIYAVGLQARRKAPPGVLIGFCLAGLFALLLYALVLPQVISYMLATKTIIARWNNPLWTLSEFVTGMQMGFAGSVGAIVALVIFGAGLLSYLRTSPTVVYLLIIPALLCAAVVMGLKHRLWPRYFFFAMGFAALVAVRGAMLLGALAARLPGVGSKQAVRAGTALCAGLIFVSALSAPAAYGPKQDYLGALAFVEANRESGDAVVTAGVAYFPYQKLYRRDWESVESLERLDSIRANAKRTWLIYTLSPQIETSFPEIMASIRRDFKVIGQFPGTLGGGTLYVCRSETAPSSQGRA
jgi:hypothetical protein